MALTAITGSATLDPAHSTGCSGGIIEMSIYVSVSVPSTTGTLNVSVGWNDGVQAQTKLYSVPIAAAGDYLSIRDCVYCAAGSSVSVQMVPSGVAAGLAYTVSTSLR